MSTPIIEIIRDLSIASQSHVIKRNMVDEEYLFKQIYEAERQYVVTRGFWDS